MIADVRDDTWDESVDVVVVGYGMAGVSAALEARAAGAEVLALDRYDGGGSTAISGGIVYAGGGTAFQRAAGVEDTPENMLAYLRTVVGDAVSERTLRRFCDESPAMIDWLTGHGVEFGSEVSPYKTSYPRDEYLLYYSGSESAGEAAEVAIPAPRGHRARGRGNTGGDLFRPLVSAADWAGVRVARGTRVTGLVREGAAVVGVEALTLRGAPAAVRRRYSALAALAIMPGVYVPQLRTALLRRLERIERRHARPLRVRAEQGVILAGGGFFSNPEMVDRYAPAFAGGLPLGTPGDDGAVIRMGMSAGGRVDRMDEISAWRFISPPSAMLGALFVGRAGVRRLDESRYGADLGHALVTRDGGVGWLLVDADLMERARGQLKAQSQWFQRVQAATLMRVGTHTGATIAEVARSAGIDVAALEATVAEHNAAIAEGRRDPMGKTDEFRAPVVTPPFRLLDVSVAQSSSLPMDTNPLPMISLGGLVVDEDTGEVLDEAGAPVVGLYAAGRSAVGICSNGYNSGLSLADCVFSGRRAGEHASARITTPTV